MSEFDNFIRGLGSDIKNAAEQVSKKAEETFEISKRRAEKVRLKGDIQKNYQKLGELIYGGLKNDVDVQNEMLDIVEKLDEDFERITQLFEEINAIKAGMPIPVEESDDWEEEYAEGYDEEDEEEVEVSIVMVEEDGEIVEEPAIIEEEEEETEESSGLGKIQEFDINID